jgi:hypothetical protein
LENVDDPNIWTSSRSGFSLNFCKGKKNKQYMGLGFGFLQSGQEGFSTKCLGFSCAKESIATNIRI